jgi:hypothetical protein
MLETERAPTRATWGADPNLVAREFRERVLPCGIDAVNRLESAVEAKLGDVRALEFVPPERFATSFRTVVEAVVATRPYRSEILARASPEVVKEVLRQAREARLGPADLPSVAERLSGAPLDVRADLVSELLHAASPDRVALLARWVWNPGRKTGILAAYGGPLPETYAATQARLGEIRLELGAIGFPSPTFAAVDVLLALSYAGRLEAATERSFQGGGIERLLPGAFPLATMLLGVRRRLNHADR